MSRKNRIIFLLQIMSHCVIVFKKWGDIMKIYTKKLIALLISGIMCVSTAPIISAANVSGDVDGNGAVNSSDALQILQYTIGIEPKGFNKSAADINGDGKINSYDALKVLQKVVGMISTVPSSKAEIVNYYNNSIINACKQPNLTVTKSEAVNIVVDSVSPNNDTVMKVCNNMVQKYAVPDKQTRTFINGKSSNGTNASNFCIKTALQPEGVKSATISKNGDNYDVTIVTIEENATFDTIPTYVNQCAYPLMFNSLDISPAVITSADATYPGVTLKATINSNGLVLKSSADMPIICTVGGKAMVFSIKATAHGNWTQSATYTY
jgi:hypothetical protein